MPEEGIKISWIWSRRHFQDTWTIMWVPESNNSPHDSPAGTLNTLHHWTTWPAPEFRFYKVNDQASFSELRRILQQTPKEDLTAKPPSPPSVLCSHSSNWNELGHGFMKWPICGLSLRCVNANTAAHMCQRLCNSHRLLEMKTQPMKLSFCAYCFLSWCLLFYCSQINVLPSQTCKNSM